VRLWDVDSGKEIKRLEGHTNRVQGAAFSPDGRYIASCGDQHDATVRIWDADRGQEVLCSERCGSGFLAIAMLPEAGYVVTTGGDGMVRLWPWKK
jgi:WD40 repeat protein